MRFSALKCITLAIAAAVPADAARRLVIPSIFEDFAAPASVTVHSPASPHGGAAVWKLETLLTAGDLGGYPLTLRRLGLATRGDPGRLRGSVTLSTTEHAALSRVFAENDGRAPVTFFVEAHAAGTAPADRTVRAFDLGGGFRFDPLTDGNLLVHLELEVDEPMQIDLAPSVEMRLLVSSDVLSARGALSRELLVLHLTADVEEPPRRTPSSRDDLGLRAAGRTAAESRTERRVRDQELARLQTRVQLLEHELAKANQAWDRLAQAVARDRETMSATVRAAVARGLAAAAETDPRHRAEAGESRRAVAAAVAAADTTAILIRPGARTAHPGAPRVYAPYAFAIDSASP